MTVRLSFTAPGSIISLRPGETMLGVDLDRLVASRLLIQANSGGGKSRAIRQLLEETHSRVQHLVVDPEGEFSTLRERFDYVLAAPKDGDVQATPKTARLLCRRVMDLGASAVMDIYDLSLHDRREFVKLFLMELMALPRSMWRPTIVVIDEAHAFAPQTGEAQSLEMVTALCTQGRKRGFCAVLATQRLSKLHKDAAAEMLNKLIGRTGLDVDVRRAGDELGFDKEQRDQLKFLLPGDFFAYGPAIANAVRKVRTGDVKTSHPEAGKVSAAPPPPPERVKKVLAQLADLAQKADEEARTIGDLERQNRELSAKVRQLERETQRGHVVAASVLDQDAISRAVTRAIALRDREVRRVFDRRETVIRQATALLERTGTAIAKCATDLQQAVSLPMPPSNGNGASHAKAAPVAPTPGPARERPAPQRRDATEQKGTDFSRGQQRILNALAEMHALGIDRPRRVQLGLFAGYNLSGGTGAQHIADLAAHGLVSIPENGVVELTDAGHAAADPTAVPRSLDELHYRVLAKVPPGQRRIAQHLISIYPEAISRADLGTAVGYNLSGGTGAQHVADLVNLGAVRIPSQGRVAASDLLFPRGLS